VPGVRVLRTYRRGWLRAEQSGAKSQVTGLVGAGLVAVLMLFLNSLLADPALEEIRSGDRALDRPRRS
jgi:hypothetical protein